MSGGHGSSEEIRAHLGVSLSLPLPRRRPCWLCRESARGSHTCTSLGTPFTQQNRGLREAGAVAWGHAARKWQSEEPTARFVPPCMLGPVRVPVR